MRSLIILLVFLATLSTLGQDNPQPELVDEFGLIHCDELLARIDNFAMQIRNKPSAIGVVVIYGLNEYLIEKLQLEIRLTSGIGRPGADVSSMVKVVRGKESGKAIMRFWVVPAGVEDPELPAPAWNMTIPKGTKPMIFHWDWDAICSYPTLFKYLKELMTANPKLRVNAVVGQGNRREFRKEVRLIRETLGSINAKRVRFFSDLEYFNPNNEFWILP